MPAVSGGRILRLSAGLEALSLAVFFTPLSNIVKSLSYYCGGYYYPYCRTYANTFDETAFSYNLGLGLRWDVNDAIFLKVAYIQQWVDSDGSPSPKTGRAEIGVMF